MDKKTIDRYNFFSGSIKWMLRATGLWPIYKSIIVVIALRSLALWIILTIPISAAIKAANSGSLDGYLKGVSIFIAGFTATLKFTVLVMNQRSMKKLVNNLSADFDRRLKVSSNQTLLLSRFTLTYFLFILFNFMVVSHFLFVASGPIRLAFKGQYVRTYPIAVPFDYSSGGLLHWISYVFEVSFCFFLWTLTCGGGMALGLFALHYSGEVKLITKKFEALKPGEHYKKELKSVVDRHSKIVKYHSILEDFYGLIVLWIVIGNSINLCIPAYQVSHITQWSLQKVYFLVSWVFLKLTETFIFAHVGNIMAEENENCSEAIYNTSWTTDVDVLARKDLLILKTLEPPKFSVKGLVIMNYPMFTAVVQTAVSYFMFIQTMKQKID